jgi:hypothetical protein
MLLKKAHLLRWHARAALRRTLSTPRTSPGTHRKMGAPPCIWTFLSSLGENGVFSILLSRQAREVNGPSEWAYLAF